MANTARLDYDETVMEQLFRRGNWQSWDDCIKWLHTQARQAGTLSQEHISSLIDHLSSLKAKGVSFPLDYREAFKLVEQFCVR